MALPDATIRAPTLLRWEAEAGERRLPGGRPTPVVGGSLADAKLSAEIALGQ